MAAEPDFDPDTLNKFRRDRLAKAARQGYGPLAAPGANPPQREVARERQPSLGECMELRERAATASHQLSVIERVLRPSGDEPDLEGFLAPKRPGTGRVPAGAGGPQALPSFATKIARTSEEAYDRSSRALAASSRGRQAELELQRQYEQRAAEERREQEKIAARARAVAEAAAAEVADEEEDEEEEDENIDYRGIVKKMPKANPDEYEVPSGVSRASFLTVLDGVMRRLVARLVVWEIPDHRWVVWSALQHTVQLLEDYEAQNWREDSIFRKQIADVTEKRLRESIPAEKLKPRARRVVGRRKPEPQEPPAEVEATLEERPAVRLSDVVLGQSGDGGGEEAKRPDAGKSEDCEEDEGESKKRKRQEEKKKREEWRRQWKERKKRETDDGRKRQAEESGSDSDRSVAANSDKDDKDVPETEDARQAKHRAAVWRQLNSGGVSTARDVRRKYVGQLSDKALDMRLREQQDEKKNGKLMSEAQVMQELRSGNLTAKGASGGGGGGRRC